jgi:hypothetical protein
VSRPRSFSTVVFDGNTYRSIKKCKALITLNYLASQI